MRCVYAGAIPGAMGHKRGASYYLCSQDPYSVSAGRAGGDVSHPQMIIYDYIYFILYIKSLLSGRTGYKGSETACFHLESS